jgi:hypothetical protein
MSFFHLCNIDMLPMLMFLKLAGMLIILGFCSDHVGVAYYAECLYLKYLNGNLSEMEECCSLLIYCYKWVFYYNLLFNMQYSKKIPVKD